MYMFLQCKIRIGRATLRSAHSVEIESSWRELTDTAVVKLPRNLSYAGKNIREYVSEGDPVKIELGFNNWLATEFEGYVREVRHSVPLEIHCEDEAYMLKRGALTKTFQNASLAGVLGFVAPGYQTVANDVRLGKVVIDKSTPAQVLGVLRETFRIYSFFKGKKLYAGFPYAETFNRHVYDFQRNVKKSGLAYRDGRQNPIQVRAIANIGTGKKTIEYVPAEKPGGAEVRTLNYGKLSDNEGERRALLRRFAGAKLDGMNREGYKGDITGFGVPATRHGDIVELRDGRFKERRGRYYIDRVKTRFGVSLYERANRLGAKAD